MTYKASFDYSDRRKHFYYRNFNDVDTDSLILECGSLPWTDLYFHPSVDDQLLIFNNLVSYLYNKYVPLKIKWVHPDSCPWFTRELRLLVREREYLYRQWRLNKSDYTRSLYRRARNRVTVAIRNAKRNYYSSKFDPDLPPKVLWGNLKKEGICSPEGPKCSYDPDDLNKYFTGLAGTRTSSVQFSYDGPMEHSLNCFSFHCIDCSILCETVNLIKSQALGYDEINPRFIKLILPYIGPYLLHVINTCLTSSSFPSIWKIAKVVPIAKVNSPTSMSDFRPISILSFLGKILEKVMCNQIQQFLTDNKLLTECQSGFRAKRSCETALLKVTTDLRQALDVGDLGVLVLLDFRKAFDSVIHHILLHKLRKNFNFSSSAVELLSSFLSNRAQQVVVDGSDSRLLPLVRGVPQGSVLGPLLFSLYINDICDVVHDVTLHLFADDVQLYLSRPLGLVEDCIARINDDLEEISRWSISNEILINPSKSQCIILHNSSINTEEITPVRVNNVTVPFIKCVSNLGVKLNGRLTCCDHVKAVLGKIYGGLRRLWLSAHVLPTRLRLRLVKTLLLPYFLYGGLVYPKLDASCGRKLEVAFNDCIRFIFRLRRVDHITPYRFLLLGCSLDTYLKRRALIFLFNLIQTKEPEYLHGNLSFMQSSRGRNLRIPTFHRLVYERSYFVQTIRLWNSLPFYVQRSVSVGEFKQRIIGCEL